MMFQKKTLNPIVSNLELKVILMLILLSIIAYGFGEKTDNIQVPIFFQNIHPYQMKLCTYFEILFDFQ